MRGGRLLASALALCGLWGCETTRASLVAGPPTEVRREPNPFAGGRDVQIVRRTEVSPEARLAAFRSVRVEPFGVENFKGGGLSPAQAAAFVHEAMREALASEGCFEAVVASGAPAPAPSAVLRGAITELYPGGRVALDAAGTSGEAARASIALVLADAESGAALRTVKAASRKGEPAVTGLNPTAHHSERSQRLALRELAGRAAAEICDAVRAERAK